MTVDITIHQVQIVQEGDQESFVMTVEDSTMPGRLLQRIIPVETFEARAAEYGFDPTDFDTILTSIMYGHYTKDDADPDTFLPYAATTEVAREAHMQRINEFKGDGQIIGIDGISDSPVEQDHPQARMLTIASDSEAENPIEFLRREVDIEPARVKVYKDYVAQQRTAAQEEKRKSEALLKLRGKRTNGRLKRKSAQALKNELIGVSDGKNPKVRKQVQPPKEK